MSRLSSEPYDPDEQLVSPDLMKSVDAHLDDLEREHPGESFNRSPKAREAASKTRMAAAKDQQQG